MKILICNRILILICFLSILSGCMAPASTGLPEYDLSSEPFDKVRAEEILRNTERCVTDLIAVGGGDAQASLQTFMAAYGALPASAGDTEQVSPEDIRMTEGWQVWRTFFNNPPTDAAGFLPVVESGLFFPTVFHERIEIKQAEIVKTVYRDALRQDENTEYLCIREEYTGSDPLLKSFRYRENYYVRAGEGWRFDHFDGDVNISDGVSASPSRLNFNYLPLKPAQ